VLEQFACEHIDAGQARGLGWGWADTDDQITIGVRLAKLVWDDGGRERSGHGEARKASTQVVLVIEFIADRLGLWEICVVLLASARIRALLPTIWRMLNFTLALIDGLRSTTTPLPPLDS
jgi:hypothetical protein